MRELIKRLGRRPYARASGFVLRWSKRQRGIALVYHRVGDPPGDPARQVLASHGRELFGAQLRHLKAAYNVVPASKLLAAVRHRRRGHRFPVAITFDDDLQSHVRVAARQLEENGLRGTFFVCGASLRQPFRFWWEHLDSAAASGADVEGTLRAAGVDIATEGHPIDEPYVLPGIAERMVSSSAEVRARASSALRGLAGPDSADAGLRESNVRRLAEGGHEIGFHTLRHEPLPALDGPALDRALTEGREEIERLVTGRLVALAYPHGRGDGRIAAAARRAGYEFGFTVRAEIIRPDADPLLLGRIEPSFHSAGRFAMQLLRALSGADDGESEVAPDSSHGKGWR